MNISLLLKYLGSKESLKKVLYIEMDNAGRFFTDRIKEILISEDELIFTDYNGIKTITTPDHIQRIVLKPEGVDNVSPLLTL